MIADLRIAACGPVLFCLNLRIQSAQADSETPLAQPACSERFNTKEGPGTDEAGGQNSKRLAPLLMCSRDYTVSTTAGVAAGIAVSRMAVGASATAGSGLTNEPIGVRTRFAIFTVWVRWRGLCWFMIRCGIIWYLLVSCIRP